MCAHLTGYLVALRYLCWPYLHVDRGATQAVYVCHLAVLGGAGAAPGAEDRRYRAAQLLHWLLREGLSHPRVHRLRK
eukprot:2663143-Pyramimonas_sp.AAC.2